MKRIKVYKKMLIFSILFCGLWSVDCGLLAGFCLATAADIQWTGQDSANAGAWNDYLNWFPQTVPTTGDNVSIDIAGANVILAQTYNVKSLSIGDHNAATLTIENFTYGTITPDNLTDNAIYIGKNGTLNLVGAAGVTTLKGTLALGKAAAVAEPSFMLEVQ